MVMEICLVCSLFFFFCSPHTCPVLRGLSELHCSDLTVGSRTQCHSPLSPSACTRHRTAQHTPTHNLYLRLLDKVRPESTASAFAYPYARICVSLSIADAFTASRHGVNTFGVQKTQRGARGENSIRPMVGVAISRIHRPSVVFNLRLAPRSPWVHAVACGMVATGQSCVRTRTQYGGLRTAVPRDPPEMGHALKV